MNGRELELSASSFGLHNESNRRVSHANNGVEYNFWGLSFWKLKCGLFFFLWNRRKWISHGIMLCVFCSNNKNNMLSIDFMIANLSFLDVGGRSLSIHHSRQELIMKELNAPRTCDIASCSSNPVIIIHHMALFKISLL